MEELLVQEAERLRAEMDADVARLREIAAQARELYKRIEICKVRISIYEDLQKKLRFPEAGDVGADGERKPLDDGNSG